MQGSSITAESYINRISQLSDKYGNFLIELMDKYKAARLPDISEEQAKEFYIILKERLQNDEKKV